MLGLCLLILISSMFLLLLVVLSWSECSLWLLVGLCLVSRVIVLDELVVCIEFIFVLCCGCWSGKDVFVEYGLM